MYEGTENVYDMMTLSSLAQDQKIYTEKVKMLNVSHFPNYLR